MMASADLVLVAILPKRRDLEIARLLGWYRIPLRRAPKVIAVDYLAFYQPASFGARGGRIEFAAPVRGHELVNRAQLFQDQPEHPRAREEYFKIQLGPLEALPTPILAGRWKRITFLYTTGAYLAGARTLADLAVREDERSMLWSQLRERANQAEHYRVQEPEEFLLDAELLALLIGPGRAD